MIAKITRPFKNEWTTTIKRKLYDEFGVFSETEDVHTGRGDERLILLSDKINEIIDYINSLEQHGKKRREKK